jgi:hypothetical protein
VAGLKADNQPIPMLIDAPPSEKIKLMTTEEFYANALLRVFQFALQRNPNDFEDQKEYLIHDLDEHAAFLTEIFKNNRSKYREN